MASRVPELSVPTLAPGETPADLKNDKSAFEEFDPDKAAERGYGFAHLSQLAFEYAVGARL